MFFRSDEINELILTLILCLFRLEPGTSLLFGHDLYI